MSPGPGLLLRAMSGSVAMEPESKLMSRAPVTTKGHTPEVMSVSRNQVAAEAILIWVASATTWGHEPLRAQTEGHI